MTRLIAGNMLTLQLADFGAEVIKIEPSGKGDPLRAWKDNGIDCHWKVYSRNKKSLSLNLREPEAINIILRLVENSNVLVENLTEDRTQVFGRTEYMTSVILDGNKSDIGKIVQVKIQKSNRSTLFGEVINNSNQKVA